MVNLICLLSLWIYPSKPSTKNGGNERSTRPQVNGFTLTPTYLVWEGFIMHTMLREGDEYRCPKCGKRWGIDEDEPNCSNPQLENLKRLKRIVKGEEK